MAELRRIVPDNSVLIQVFFGTRHGKPAARARQLHAAILTGHARCIAPDQLIIEFVKVAFDFRSGFRTHNATASEIDQQLQAFREAPIQFLGAELLVDRVIELCRTFPISPVDAWYLAAAQQSDAELWISHDHADGFANACRHAHNRVFTLEQNDFFNV